MLADHFLKKFGEELGKPNIQFSRKALDLLYNYPWPGNVRELENVIQRGLVLTDGTDTHRTRITDFHSVLRLCGNRYQTKFHVPGESGSIIPFEKIKENAVRQALKNTDGNIAEAALKLKIGRATLYRLVEKYKIKI